MSLIKYLLSAFHVYLVQSSQQSYEDDFPFPDRKLILREAMQRVQMTVTKRLSVVWLEVHF